MIRGMVDQLSERLASEGGPAEDSGTARRLARGLGEAERAKAAYASARAALAGDAAALAAILAAQQAGVAQ